MAKNNNSKPTEKTYSENVETLNKFDMYTTYTALRFYLFNHKFTSVDKKIVKQATFIFSPEGNLQPDETKHTVEASHILFSALALHYAYRHRVAFLNFADRQDAGISDLFDKTLDPTEDKIVAYSRRCQAGATSPEDVDKRLHHDIRIAKHGYIRSALDNIFKFYFVNHKNSTDQPLDMLGILAVHVMDKDSSSDIFSFFVIDSVIQGTLYAIKHHQDDIDIDEQKGNVAIFRNLQSHGLKYMVCDGSSMPHAVRLTDFLHYTDQIEGLRKSLTVVNYNYKQGDK